MNYQIEIPKFYDNVFAEFEWFPADMDDDENPNYGCIIEVEGRINTFGEVYDVDFRHLPNGVTPYSLMSNGAEDFKIKTVREFAEESIQRKAGF